VSDKISGLDRMRMVRDQRENELVLPLQIGLLAARNELHSTRYQLAMLQAALKKIEATLSSKLTDCLMGKIAHKMADPILSAVRNAVMKMTGRHDPIILQVSYDDLIMHDQSSMPRRILDRWLSTRPRVGLSVSTSMEPDDAVEVVRTHVVLPSINFNHDELVRSKAA
jgi:hypothetical protein